MSAPSGPAYGQGRLYDILRRAYRVRTYRPARYYLVWYFLLSILVTFLGGYSAFHAWQLNGLAGLSDALWYAFPTFVSGAGLAVLSTFYVLLSSGYFGVIGDRGIFSLGTLPATAPIVTKSTFIVSTESQVAMYGERLRGARITRYFVWRWGRKGGCKDWPGKAGGKSEGYYAVVVYTWEVAEYRDPVSKKIIREVLKDKPCRTCNGTGLIEVPELSEDDLKRMATEYPGLKRGNVIDLPYQVMPDRYLEELPHEVADAIQHDEEYRATSRVDVMYDLLPQFVGLGSVLDHNAQVELFGLQFDTKWLRKTVTDLNIEIAQISQLRGGIISGTPGLTPQGSRPR